MIRDHIKMPEKICIIGLGQMGASIAMGLKQRNFGGEIIAYARKQKDIDYAIENNIIDSGSTDPKEVLAVADLTILCLPVEPLIEFVKVNAEYFNKGSIVTDISSVKSIIVDEVRPVLTEQGVHFIGSHPMAGNEKSGQLNGNPDLYVKTVIFICSYPTDDPAAVTIIREFWRELDAQPFEVDAIEHDEAVAYTSHMLHISAAVATRIALDDSKYDLAKLACAGSFRDTTRIAGSCPKMWRDITKTNKTAILKAMQQNIDELENLKEIVTDGDWDQFEQYLAKGRELRGRWWEDYQQLKK